MTRDALCEVCHRWFCDASARHHLPPDVHQAVEEGAGSDDDALGVDLCSPDGAHADSSHFCALCLLCALREQFLCLILPDVEISGFIEMAAPFPDEFSSVALGSRAPYGRPLAYVQHSELDGGGISDESHLTTEGIDLSDYLSLGDASYGRIARHLCNLVHIHCYQAGLCTHIGAGTSSFATSMTASDDDDVVFQYHIPRWFLPAKLQKTFEIAECLPKIDYLCLRKQKSTDVMEGTMSRAKILVVLLLMMSSVVLAQQKHSDGIDDVLQYVPYASVIGLKVCGVESRDQWPKLLVATAASWVVTAGVTYGLKHTVREWRPDETDQKSFPSGHTAFAFAGATMLHKEYGHLSPWISVAGFGVATFTAVDRVLKDRHHWYDVLAGAGIGVLSTELTSYLSGKLFKDDQVVVGFSGNRVDLAIRW